MHVNSSFDVASNIGFNEEVMSLLFANCELLRNYNLLHKVKKVTRSSNSATSLRKETSGIDYIANFLREQEVQSLTIYSDDESTYVMYETFSTSA